MVTSVRVAGARGYLLEAVAHLRPSGLFLMKLLSHSEVTDLGRSSGRPRARSQKSWASTPGARGGRAAGGRWAEPRG